MSGPFIIPQRIFDFSQVPLTGILQPNAVQDSGTLAVAVGPGWTQIFAATAGPALWTNVLQVTSAAGANTIEMALGAAGAEVILLTMTVPPDAATFGWTLLRSNIFIAAGTRVAMRASAIVSNIETHIFYRV